MDIGAATDAASEGEKRVGDATGDEFEVCGGDQGEEGVGMDTINHRQQEFIRVLAIRLYDAYADACQWVSPFDGKPMKGFAELSPGYKHLWLRRALEVLKEQLEASV